MLIAEKGSRQQQSSFRLSVKHVWMDGRTDGGGEKKVAKSRKMLSSCQNEINERGAFSRDGMGSSFSRAPSRRLKEGSALHRQS